MLKRECRNSVTGLWIALGRKLLTMRYESYASHSFLSVSPIRREFYPGCMESSEVRSRDAGQTPMRSGFCARCKCPTMRNPSELRQMVSVHGRTEK
jgi:hypothetical protein